MDIFWDANFWRITQNYDGSVLSKIQNIFWKMLKNAMKMSWVSVRIELNRTENSWETLVLKVEHFSILVGQV